jgi:3-oxoacyl-[acyl-carrier protein] reductase
VQTCGSRLAAWASEPSVTMSHKSSDGPSFTRGGPESAATQQPRPRILSSPGPTHHPTLSGSTAVVTGAASGLGRAAAVALAAGGAGVIVAGLEPEGLQDTAAAIRDQGGSAVPVKIDISNAQEVRHLAEMTASEFGGADILLNNSAIYPSGPWFEVTESEWDQVFAVNVKGYWLCARAFYSQMLERGGGSIINMSSVTFFLGSDGFIHYVSSKGAVVGFTRALAREVGQHNIRVNAIAPGAFPTRAERLPGRDLDKFNREVLANQALKRRGQPEDVAGAVVFFAGRASSFITGQTLLVDGGWFMH